MPFDPNKPFTVVEESDGGGFDPSKPFTVIAPTEPSDEFGIGEEVRGVGRSLERGGRRFVQQADIIGLRRTGEIGDDLAKAKADLAQFDAEFPNTNPIVNPTGYAWRQRQIGTIAGLEGEQRRYEGMAQPLAESFSGQQRKIDAIPYTRAQEEFQAAKGFKGAVRAFVRNPVEMAATTIAESAPTMALTMAGAATGPGMPIVAGAASHSAESAGRVTSAMARNGVDLKDPNQVLGWFRDRAKSAPEIAKADMAALGPAAFDALTAGVAGRWLSAARGRGIRPVVGATATEVGVQAAGGGAGSIAGNVIAGEAIDWKDVILEVIGELVPTEAISNVTAERARISNERINPREDVARPTIPATQIQGAGSSSIIQRLTADPEAEVEAQAGTTQSLGASALENPEAEALAAQDRVTAAVADRQPISGQDARLAGARDRMADMSYVFVEDQDVYVPVRPTGRASRARQMISRGDLTAVQPLAEEARPIAGTPETPAPVAPTPEPVTPATTPKVSDDELQVAVQSPMTLGTKQVPGYVQVDSMVGGENQWSSNPTKLRAEGYDMPTQEELLKLPQGKYTLTDAKRRLAEIEANETVQPEPSGQPQQAPAVARPTEPATPATPAVNRPSGETAAASEAAPTSERTGGSAGAAVKPFTFSESEVRESAVRTERKRRPNGDDITSRVEVSAPLEVTDSANWPQINSDHIRYVVEARGDFETRKAPKKAEAVWRVWNPKTRDFLAQGLTYKDAVAFAKRAMVQNNFGSNQNEQLRSEISRVSRGTQQRTGETDVLPSKTGSGVRAGEESQAPSGEPAAGRAGDIQPVAGSSASAQLKFRVGASPQTWTRVERLTPTAAERQNSEQPMRVRNDRTGAEEVVLESDMTPVRERTEEERAAKPKRRTKAQLDKQLRDAGMDPSAFTNADEKRNALDRAAAKIEELQKKLRGSRSTVSMGVPKAILDLALETARLALRGGSTLIQAIDSAINVIRERMGADFNPEVEASVRENITNELSTPDEEGQRQQFFGAEIGEVKEEIESVQAITTALKDSGYEVGDRVTEDNTANAWRLFTAFTDPKVRAQTIADLRAAVPQEMAAGILHSQIWKYAIRMAAKGDASLFRAMAQNSNQFVLTDGPTFRSTLGRALRALRLGADFTTWKNELERVKAQKAAIAKELGVEVSLIDQLIENLNGADVDAAAVERTIAQTKLPGGETVQEVLDENEQVAPDPTQEESTAIDDEAQEEQMSRADKTASEILRRLELDYAGVEWLKEGTAARDQIRRILREHYRGREPIVPIQGNTNHVIKALSSKFQAVAGVSEEIADQLAFAAETKRQTDWANARNRLISRASRSRKLTGLIEEIKATPYLTQSDPNWIRETAQDWFMSNGLSREQASAAAEVFQNEFRAKLLEAQTKIAERMLAKSKPESVKEFVAALRAGVLDPEKPWAEAYAEKAGFKSPTNAQFQQLAELELRLQEPDLTAPERAEIGEKMMGIYLHLKLPPPVMQRIAANFVVTNLTGLRTMTVNVFAPLTRLLTERTLATIARPQDALRNIQQLWEAYKDFPRRVKFSLTKDAYTFINNEFEQSTNEIRRIWETGLKDLQSDSKFTRVKGATKLIYGSQQFVMRLLNAVDQAGAVTEREVQMANYATEAFRRSGLSSNQTTELVQAVSRLKRQAYEDGIEGGLTPDQARIHSDEVAIEQLEDFVRERAGDTPEAHTMARKAAEAAEKDAYSAIGRLAPGVQEEMEGGVVSRLIYHNILRLASRLRGGKGADPILGVSLLGYVSIPFRTARFIAWNTPYGLLRLGINKYRKSRGLDSWWKQSLANEYQERHRLKMALTGSAVLAVMSGLGAALLGLSSDDEAGDDKFGIYITGAGPKNKNLKDSWEKSGFRPNSINIIMGGKPTSIPLTRIGEPLAHYAWILAARDDYGWRKREAEAAGKKLDETWTAQVGHSLGTYVGLLGQRGILQNISQWARIGSGEGGTEKAVADIATRLAASAALPWLGMQRSILDIVQGRVDRSSIQSTMAANFAIPGLAFQKRAVNRFGDPVSNQTWFGKMANTGVPLAFQVADTDDNQRFYRTLAQKGAAPSELRRYVLEDRFGPLTDDQFAEFSRRSGAVLKQSVTRNLAAIEKMTPEAAKEYLTKATVQADRTAAAAMGLKREQPSASPESSAAPVPRAPAATLSTAPRASAGRARSLSRRPRGFALRTPRARSSLATMRTPRLRTSRARASISRPRRTSTSRARSSLSTRRRTRTSLLR
jgi:hypothetical protein